jgi:hypothetical protein
MANLIQDIKPRGIASAYVDAPFDEGKTELESNGYSIISLEENAKLRMQEGRNSDVSRNGNWVREGVLYVPSKGKFLTKNSPIMANAKEATECHRNGTEFYLTDEQVERSLDGAVMLDEKDIPTNRFGEHVATVYAFGDNAKDYGEFLKEVGIDEMPVYLANNEDKLFARQLWFRSLDNRSVLVGDSRSLGCDYRVRGVRKGTADAQKNLEAYTPLQIAKVLKSKGLSGIESTLIEGLRQ